jgi:hypothetical protein
MKKIIASLLVSLVVFSFGTGMSFATSDSPVVDPLTINEPTDIQIRGGSIPSNVWDISKKGTYSFDGTAIYDNALYTSYKFAGKTSYSVTVNNRKSTALRVMAKTLTNTFVDTTVAANGSKTFTVYPGSKSDKWYLRFSPNSGSNGVSTYGTVK